VVVRDAHLGRLVGGDPLAVIAGNRGAQHVLAPGLPAILAGADRDIRQTEARHVDVVDAAGVRVRRGAQVRVAAPGPHSPGRLGELVRRLQRRVVQAAVRGLTGESAGREAELRSDVYSLRVGGAD